MLNCCSDMFLSILYIALFITTISINRLCAGPSSWKTIERLIEENPYIVALLNKTYAYMCTGTIINKRTVLTSGTCVVSDPRRVAVGYAVINHNVSQGFTLPVAYTRLHADYNFEIRADEPNFMRMHSNLGLVYVTEPMLKLYVTSADLGIYFAPELQGMDLTMVGYGKLKNQRIVGIQHQKFSQAPCVYPRWYYCICGNEVDNLTRTYEREFGNGAPVLFGDEVVAVTAAAAGTPFLEANGVKYNVFTVIGPYLSWIEKADQSPVMRRAGFSEPAPSTASSNIYSLFLLLYCVIKIIIHFN